jgi:NAD(P)-dependent dehydrogenase (short-subunit alcohol dehydrogenase family)
MGFSDTDGRVAVVTGAASGIGLAFARRFAAEGLQLVLADIDKATLAEVADGIPGSLAIPTDVRHVDDVQAVADATLERFGRVDVLCNNAGVTFRAPLLDLTHEDWRWVIETNLWGVIHGIEVFLPHLVANPAGAHIVNTASGAGLNTRGGIGAYTVSKHGVVALSEVIRAEMTEAGHRVGISVLCPSVVRTNIIRTERNRPADVARTKPVSATAQAVNDAIVARFATEGVEPDWVAGLVWQAIGTDAFLIFTEPDTADRARARTAMIQADVPLV